MKFVPLRLSGAWLIEAEPMADERGFFTRLIDRETFREHGLETELLQASMSHNTLRGTLRGMHWQVAPFGEIKLVRVTAGSIQDVIVDLRKNSPTYMELESVFLTSDQPSLLYIPEGFAHGFQTLEDATEVYYHMNQIYDPTSARSFLWSDPQFEIPWSVENPILSDKDRNAPPFTPAILT